MGLPVGRQKTAYCRKRARFTDLKDAGVILGRYVFDSLRACCVLYACCVPRIHLVYLRFRVRHARPAGRADEAGALEHTQGGLTRIVAMRLAVLRKLRIRAQARL